MAKFQITGENVGCHIIAGVLLQIFYPYNWRVSLSKQASTFLEMCTMNHSMIMKHVNVVPCKQFAVQTRCCFLAHLSRIINRCFACSLYAD